MILKIIGDAVLRSAYTFAIAVTLLACVHFVRGGEAHTIDVILIIVSAFVIADREVGK